MIAAAEIDLEALTALAATLPGTERRWCLWRYDHEGKKPPHRADGTAARTNNPEDFTTAEDAATGYLFGQFDGLGVRLDDDLQAIDLDCAIDEHGNTLPWAQEVLALVDGYAEVSPSGRGIRLLVTGWLFGNYGAHFGEAVRIGNKDKRPELAVMAHDKYVTLTGCPLPGYEGRPVRRLSATQAQVLRNLIDAHKGKAPTTVDPFARVNRERAEKEFTAQTMQELQSATRALKPERAEHYSDWISTLHALKSVPEDWQDQSCELWHEHSARSTKYDRDQSQAKWDGASPAKSSYRAVFGWAMADGWINPQAGRKAGQGVPLELPEIKRFTRDDLQHLSLTPRTLLPGLLYADVRLRAAAGGVGKTTTVLYEAATLALGLPLWGRTPPAPVRTLIITKEDPQALLGGRLREIMAAMMLTDDQADQVLERVRILDVSESPLRLSVIEDDVVQPNREALLALADMAKDFGPDWIVIDPAVSFGVGEARVNDAEQGLIEAARILRNRLDACIEFVHHVGKQNARANATDQYASRGGTAFADGSRMVAIMTPLPADEWPKETGQALRDGEVGVRMTLPKLSYCPPQADVFIARRGFAFRQVQPVTVSPEVQTQRDADRVAAFLMSEEQAGRTYSMNTLEAQKDVIGMTRKELRLAVRKLETTSRLHRVGRGKAEHLKAVAPPANSTEAKQMADLNLAAPFGEVDAGQGV